MIKVKEDLTDRRFGRLRVIQQADDYIKPNGKKEAQWLCQCTCSTNKKIVVLQQHLKSGHTTSCGCIKLEVAVKNGKTQKKFNEYRFEDNYVIGLTSNTNKEFYIDLDDYNTIKEYCWSEDQYGYVVTTTHKNKKSISIKLHNMVMNAKRIDHINRNKMDNRKNNLRLANQSINSTNRSLASNNTSGFIGVSYHKQTDKWMAYIKKNGKQVHLGTFNNKRDAIIARLRAEKEYFGEYASQRHLFEEYGIE